MRKGRGGAHLKLHSSLIDALKNFGDTSFLGLVVRNLPGEPPVAQLLQLIQFFFKGTRLSFGRQFNPNRKNNKLYSMNESIHWRS